MVAQKPKEKKNSRLGGLTAEEVKRLFGASRRSRYRYRKFRDNRKKMIRAMVGKHYSDSFAGTDAPLNVLGLYQKIMRRSLVGENPRVMLSVMDQEHEPHVSAMQGWVNKQIEKMYLCDALQACVVDALYGFGMMKVGLSSPAATSAIPYGRWLGDVFAERIDPDDVVFDFYAKDFHNVQYIGHRYRCPVEELNRIYEKATKTEEGSDDPFVASEDDQNEDGDERIGVIGRGTETSMGDEDEFMPMTDVWEIYLPRQRKIVIARGRDSGMPVDEKDVIAVEDYVGPDCGPYTILGYEIIPGNLVPKGPAQDLYDLHKQINRSVRKLFQQADRLKQVMPVRGGQVDEAGNLKEAADGEFFACENADTFQPVTTGGPDPVLSVFLTEMKNLFSWMAGNLDVVGGLSVQAGTATQEKQLNQNAGGTVTSMAQKTNIFTSKVLKNLCWYYHRNPTEVMRDKYPTPGLPGEYISRELAPEDRRKIPWNDLDINIDPYSMQAQTPESMMMFVRGFVNEMMPIMPLLQQQGLFFDADYYVRTVGELGNQPHLNRIFRLMEPQSPDQPGGEGGQAEEPGMPSVTSRTNERVSTSEKTQPGQDRNAYTTVMGKASQSRNGGGMPMMNGNGRG